MSRFDVNRLFAKGHEIAGHTLTHAALVPSTLQQTQLQMCVDRGFLHAYKWNSTSFAYPYALVNDDIVAMAKTCNYCNARAGSFGLWDPLSCSNCPAGDTYPPVDKWKIKSYSVKTKDTSATLIDRINRSIQEANSETRWVVFNFHKLCASKCNTHSEFGINSGTFQALIDHLKTLQNQQLLQVKTMKQVMLDHGDLLSCDGSMPDNYAIHYNSDNVSALDGIDNNDGCSSSATTNLGNLLTTLGICILLVFVVL
jgi:hypothetical protein